MPIDQTAPSARTDVSPAATGAKRGGRPHLLQGSMLTVGAVSWAGSQAAFGLDPKDQTEIAVQALGGGLFQLGLLALLLVLFRTQALGTGRLARFFVRFEMGLVTLAIGSTVADGIGVSDMDQAGWAMLDAFWPLSMLGMFMIGIRIAIAGRWSGVSRFWPMVAESWAVVVIPTMGIFGDDAAVVVSIVHLCVGYGVLGQIVARKQG